MTPGGFHHVLWPLILAIGAQGASQRPHPPAARPNVILILADDLGFECIGAYGGTSYRTPHLDRLARQGMRFQWCFATPLCSPSRVQLMTGRYGFRNWRNWGVLDPSEYTFGHVFRDSGYATCVSGKWQLCRFDDPANADHPRRAGFDRFCVWTWRYQGRKPSRYYDPWIWQDGALRKDLRGAYGPDIHCRYVVDFIREHRRQPFFVYWCLNLAHAPFVPPPTCPVKDRTPHRRYFAGMMQYLDLCVGRVIRALERYGLREKTLILFTADNGTPRGIRSRLGKRVIEGGKGLLTDAGTRVPLIAHWPGVVPPGSVCEDLVDFSDFFPTFVELLRTPLRRKKVLDGRSFLPQLTGKKGTPRQWVYFWFDPHARGRPARAIRTKSWKYYSDGRLFHISEDPLETRPLKTGEQVESCRTKLALFLQEAEARR